MVARSLLVILGVFPLLGTVGWATWRHISWDAQGYEKWLGARLGLEVQLTSVEHPTPTTERVGQADLLDPETGRLLARAERVTIHTSATAIQLHCESLFIPRSRLMSLWRLLHDRALRERRLLARPIELEVNQTIVSSDSGQTEFASWMLELGRREDGAFATSTFVERAPQAQPVEIYISRQAHGDSWTTELDLLTKSRVALTTLFGEPAWLSALGPQVGLNGHLWVQQTDQDWSADFCGKIDGLELGRFVARFFPHEISGTINASIRQLLIKSGRISHLEGQLHGAGGQIGSSLLDACEQFLDMQLSGSPGELVSFDELGLTFRIDHRGAVLKGSCEAGPGVILNSAAGPLLSEAAKQPTYGFNLIRALANEPSPLIFWTENCKPLLDLLPPPPAN